MAVRRIRAEMEDGGAATAITIDKDKNSQLALKWAVDNIIGDSPHCILLHVRSRSRESAAAHSDNKEDAHKFFLPFRGFCARKGIIAKEVLLHDLDIASALTDYITKNSIANVVVGASTRNSLLKKLKTVDVPTSLLKSAPDSCAVFVVSKGKLLTSRSASRPQTPQSSAVPSKQSSLTSFMSDRSSESLSSGDISRSSSTRSGGSSRSIPRYKPRSTLSQANSPEDSSMQSFSMNSQSEVGSDISRSMASSDSSYSILERSTTYGSSLTSFSSMSMSESCDAQDCQSSCDFQEQQNQALDADMRRLKLELQQTMELYASFCRETPAARGSAQDLEGLKVSEIQKLEETRPAGETARVLAEKERQKSRAAIQAAEMGQRLAEMETQKRKLAERLAKQEEQERMAAVQRLSQNRVSYRRYKIREIEDATDGFSEALKIGEGGYGPVYRAVMDHTAVAIKVLKSDISQGLKQFHQEVEVLSSIRHPNMVILLGACPEYGCLVYEYMENGTLEDRLFCRNNTPPLSWRTRFRITAEIATGLLFLHQAKPKPLVHRDLKPANILLDRNFISKISDVGLARLVPQSATDSFSHYHMTAAAGTFCYIDPEYQQTGMLGVKSDLYSLGVVLLQIITAMPPIGLSHKVETAIENGRFQEILDPAVPDWPIEETLAFAKLALQCCELRKKDRPDLATVLLPALNRLREYTSEDLHHNSGRTPYVPRPYKSVPLAKASLVQMSSQNFPGPRMSPFPETLFQSCVYHVERGRDEKILLTKKWKFDVDQSEARVAVPEIHGECTGFEHPISTQQKASCKNKHEAG